MAVFITYPIVQSGFRIVATVVGQGIVTATLMDREISWRQRREFLDLYSEDLFGLPDLVKPPSLPPGNVK